MDITALVFYAVVCGVLGWAGPKLGDGPVRAAIGVAVGIAAAGVLPYLKALIGYSMLRSIGDYSATGG